MKKEKGKMKSEKVWMSLLYTFALLLFTSAAQAELVEFRDYDAATGTFTNAVRECTLVTGGTRTLSTGWWAVKGEVTIPEGSRLVVQGAANLVLCDGAKLSVEKPGEGLSAVNTTAATLVIYGQTSGSGALAAVGGVADDFGFGYGGAGIGGDGQFSCGTVTINGGTVTATGGERGAGIGGGDHGYGGTVTINGGTVTATGGYDGGAGIGGGTEGAGGTVMINGGTVTATGGKLGGGTVGLSAGIGGGYQGDGGTVTISGGNVKAKIPSQPKNGKGDDVYCVTVEGFGSLEGLDDYGTRDIYPIDGVGYLWLPNGKHKFSVNGQRCVANVRGTATTAGVLLDGVTYCDAEGNYFTANDVERIFQNMETIGDGAWYAVDGVVDMETLFVSGEANIILMDGAKLIVNGIDNRAGVEVTVWNTLNIWGQVRGDGELMTHGGDNAAGIGGGHGDAGGTITINGGTVTATGGYYGGAGIGGGWYGAGGTVTINGGKVTAQGGTGAEDIGHGADSSESGTISISGGIFWKEPEDGWLAPNSIKVENSDEATKAKYPWAVVLPPCAVTVGNFPRGIVAWTSGDETVTNMVEGGVFKVKQGTENVKVIFTAKPGYELVGETVVNLGTVTADVAFGAEGGYRVPSSRVAPVEYVDADGVVQVRTNSEFSRVTSSTKKFADGKWYAVIDDVVLSDSIIVEGTAHLILCDWATLAITNSSEDATVSVGGDNSLTIYGQTANTGRLTVKNGKSAAGIGGNKNGTCGAITIHGGTVKAEGGAYSAGIGCGMLGGGSVTITGGRIWAIGHGEGSDDIGNAKGSGTPCEVAISGGIFARKLNDNWLALGYAAVANADEATRADYPWAVGKLTLTIEGCYDASDLLVQWFPIGKVRTVDYAPTAEEIAAADAAIDAAAGSGSKLAPPLAVQNADDTLTIIRGGVEANRLIRRLGDLPPDTDIPLRVVGKNRETMLMNSAYDPNVPKTWKSDDFGAMAVVTNFQHYSANEENWQQNMTNQMAVLYALAEAATNGFTQAFRSVTNLLGRADGYCRDSLKGKARAYAKAVENMPETGGWPNVNTLYDVFGCTFVLGDEDDFAKVLALVEAEFGRCGFRTVRIKNCYYTDGVNRSGYADVKVNVRHANGFTCEAILIEANMNREKMEGVAHEVYEIRRDYDASTSAAKDGDLQMIMDELDHLMRIVQFNPREGDSHDQFQKTYGYLVQNLPNLRDVKYAEIWSANTRAHLEDYIARIRDPVMYDGYRARRTELAARTDEVRVGMALGSEAKDEAAVRALPGRHATITFDAHGLPVIGVDDGDDAGLSVWGKERLTDAWWVTPHVPTKHHFFRVTDHIEGQLW